MMDTGGLLEAAGEFGSSFSVILVSQQLLLSAAG
jgi:hypothetical protein